MLFNSDVFLKFFAAFLLLYYLVRKHLEARNLLIVAASFLFYGWWDYRFLSLLCLTSLLDYYVGLKLEPCQDPRRRKLWVGVSVVANLGLLGFFKYCGFFVDSWVAMLHQLGFEASSRTWNIVLPVGISFYTFQEMSYCLDIYRGQVRATRSLVNFLAYVSFFPQLVAGPIERASNLLPQFERTLTITPTRLAQGTWLMIWGMFKKVVLADSLAPLVELVFQQPTDSGLMVFLGVVAFGIQIYGDFSGYSDIARGLAFILGFDLMVNFNLPYVATDIRDFWRRWHISLSTWLRDYLYIPLGGNRLGPKRTQFNLFATMLLGGLWHGAAWNFIFWGAWQGIGLLAHRWWEGRVRTRPRGWPVVSWVLTMLFVLYGWLLFRANSLDQLLSYTMALGHWHYPPWIGSYLLNLTMFSLPLVLMQVWQARTGNLLVAMTLPFWVLATLEGLLLVSIGVYWGHAATPFIYFQF